MKRQKQNRQSHKIQRGAAFEASQQASKPAPIVIYHTDGTDGFGLNEYGVNLTFGQPDPARFETRGTYSKHDGYTPDGFNSDNPSKPIPYTSQDKNGATFGVVSKDSPLLKGLPEKSGWDGAF